MDLRFQSTECSRLAQILAIEQANEIRLSDEMTGRAAKQLVLNTIGVAALALGGVGFGYSVQGEGYKREMLATTRGEIEVMKKVLAEKRCRPEGANANLQADAALSATSFANAVRRDGAGIASSELSQLGGPNCVDETATTTPDVFLKRGRSLASLNQYQAAMHCLLRAMDEGKGTTAYREACEFIATMYEFGWGVDKNIATARIWLQRATM